MKGDRATTVGKIPDALWLHQKWFIGKIQIPLMTSEQNPPALIYDETRKWSLYVPIEWVKTLKKLQKEKKAYYWMWFDKNHAIQVEEGTAVEETPYW